MDRRMYHKPRIGPNNPERRKALFDRRDRGPILRALYASLMLPVLRFLHWATGGRLPARIGGN